MSNKFRSKLQMSAVLIGLLLSMHARAATVFTQVDAEQLHSLVKKSAAAADDVLDSFKLTAHNDPAFSCLEGIDDKAVSV
ncbi:MAG TPA: hypothetical protein VMV54_09045, partial [Acidocella sp.]|nr:hypothetical protein [Acidocella sp.]